MAALGIFVFEFYVFNKNSEAYVHQYYKSVDMMYIREYVELYICWYKTLYGDFSTTRA